MTTHAHKVKRTLRSTPALPRASFNVATSVLSTFAAAVAVFGTGVVVSVLRDRVAWIAWAARGAGYW